jgi:hypothetical protein
VIRPPAPVLILPSAALPVPPAAALTFTRTAFVVVLVVVTQTEKDFGEMFGQAARIRRELVPGSLEVFPIKNYGAMQVGRHRFCHVENGKEECGTFSFVHVWRRTDRGWQIARAISYGH